MAVAGAERHLDIVRVPGRGQSASRVCWALSLAIGVLGLVLLLVWRLLPQEAALPAGLHAAAATGVQALKAAVQGWQGTGAWLSAVAVVVALLLAVVFAVAALRRMPMNPAGSRGGRS